MTVNLKILRNFLKKLVTVSEIYCLSRIVTSRIVTYIAGTRAKKAYEATTRLKRKGDNSKKNYPLC